MAVYHQLDPIEDESHQMISSFFLGPKAENYEWFKKNLIEILEAQRDARYVSILEMTNGRILGLDNDVLTSLQT